MAETQTRQAGEERLTEAEISTLRERFAKERQEAVTIRALAEASGLDETVVREHLRQIRTERAFSARTSPAPTPDRPVWLLVATATVALAIAGVVTFRRVQAEQLKFAPMVPQSIGPVTTMPVTTRTPAQTGTHLPGYGHGSGVGVVPSGFRVSVAYDGQEHFGSETGEAPYPRPYEALRDQLVQAIVELSEAAGQETRMGGTRPDLKPPFRDMLGNVFDLKEGYLHFGIEGWPGSVEGQVKFPIGAAEKAQVVEAVEKVFQEARQSQEQGLAASREAVVTPPPGFRVMFGGRRNDEQVGAPLAFAPVDLGRVQARLESALLNAATRDSAPPQGAWSENAQREAKIPTPDRYAGSIYGPGGTIPFDIPSRPARAFRNAVRDLAKRAAEQVKPINERASR